MHCRLSASSLLAACAQNSSGSDAVRICDDHGCPERLKNQVSYELESDVVDQEDSRIAALKGRAKTQPKVACAPGLRCFRGDGVRQGSYQALMWTGNAA